MIDPKSSEDLINEAKALTPEVYKDVAKPALQEIGNVAGRTVKALLSPIRGLLWGWEQIEKLVEEGVKKRFEAIPEERRKTPDPEIAVPLIQALSYTAQNETLREMYLNLLANSMDTSKAKDVHPSFVELIKQMNSLDAKVFDKLSKGSGYQQVINPTIEIKDQNKFFSKATPDWFIGWTIENYDAFDVSASFVRLSKFGLIELMLDRTAGEDNYNELKSDKYLSEILARYQEDNPNLVLEIGAMKSVVYVNEYGMQFKKVCK
jgi:Abortive infection alpha